MSDKNQDLEIEALSDDDLEEVAGGVADDCHETSCSKSDCSGGGDDTVSMDIKAY